ncbi:hypothetical protein F5Y08DRAFT_349023 [Xylaria arbuscula]|nr:hypothetical protein F5Y08DRAFT_349023 [Xylaria arbuscula]
MANLQLDTEYYPVYLGLWVNWSHGPVFGHTLTLTRRDGGFLIAFTALFISFVSTRGWRILAFGLHRYYSSPSPQHAVYHQAQAILRNSDTQTSILQLTNLLYTKFRWGADSRDEKYRLRKLLHIPKLAFILLLAVFYTTALTIAGGFSSQISTAVGNEVLIKSLNCGWNSARLLDNDNVFRAVPLLASDVNNAANYAQQCYSNSSIRVLDCGRLVARSIPRQIDTQAPCPFLNKDICRTSNKNIRIDSGYIDSRDSYGLNTPDNEKVLSRFVAHCAPMKTQGYTSRRKILPANINGRNVTSDDVIVYHYGNITTPNGGRDYMATAQSIDSQYSYYESLDTTTFYANYNLFPMLARVDSGRFVINRSDFIPLDSIFPTDGDIYMLFLSGNGVTHTKPSEDEWYRVSPKPLFFPPLAATSSPTQIEFYLPSEEASPLGCVVQNQFCVQDSEKCGVLGGTIESMTSMRSFLNTNNHSEHAANSSFDYFANTIANTQSPTGIISQMGPTILESQTSLWGSRQGPLPPDQWQRDVTRWFDTTLANTQLAFLKAAYFNPTDQTLLQLRNYATGNEKEFCGNQKIRSSSYTSFSLFGLLFTYISGVFIIATSFLIEPIFWILHKRLGYQPYATLEWTTNTTLQLQRLAHEGVGFGTWSRGTEKIPVTLAEDLLGCIDLTIMSHPVLGSNTVQDQDQTDQNGADQFALDETTPDETAPNESMTDQSGISLSSQRLATVGER